MLQHVLIGDAAPALLAARAARPAALLRRPDRRCCGVSGSRRSVRARRRVAAAAGGRARRSGRSPSAAGTSRPPTTTPPRHRTVHDLEHASFVVAGLLVWSLLIDPARQRPSLARPATRVVAALLFLMGTVISDVLIFSLHPLYPAYARQADRVFGLSPLRDQQLAGLVMSRRADPGARDLRRRSCSGPSSARRRPAPAARSAPAAGRVSSGRTASASSRSSSSWRSSPRCSTSRDVRRAAGRTSGRAAGRACVFGLGLALDRGPAQLAARDALGALLLLAHLLQNALIADWGPPLLILGLTPAMRERIGRAGGPASRAADLGLSSRCRSGSRSGTASTSRRFYDWALRDGWPLNLEHVLLIGAGLRLLVARVRRAAAAADALGTLAYLGIAFVTAPVALARLHLLLAAVLLVLRARAAALGHLADPRPELRRDPDERRPDEHLLHRLRLVAAPRARRGRGRAAPARRRVPRSRTATRIPAGGNDARPDPDAGVLHAVGVDPARPARDRALRQRSA